VTLAVSAPDADPVTTVGSFAAVVVNVSSAPSLVPDEFVATTRNQYVAPGLRLLKVAVTATVPDPAPSLKVGVLDESDAADVPYSKWSLVSSAPGLTVPLSVAVVEPIADACPVAAVAVAEAVVNRASEPSVVPDEFEATNSK